MMIRFDTEERRNLYSLAKQEAARRNERGERFEYEHMPHGAQRFHTYTRRFTAGDIITDWAYRGYGRTCPPRPTTSASVLSTKGK